MTTIILFSVIIAGFALIWGRMIDPGKQMSVNPDGSPIYEPGTGGMLAVIGRKLVGNKLGDPLGLCPLCFSFWASIGAMAVGFVLFGFHPLHAAGVVAMTHLIIRFIFK